VIVYVVIGVRSGIIDCVTAWSTKFQAQEHQVLLKKGYQIKPGCEEQSLNSVKVYELSVN